MPPVDVIIPALNEEQTIAHIVSTFRKHPMIGQVIVMVDAKTTDKTGNIAGACGAIVNVTGNISGKGELIQNASQLIQTPHVILSDGDYDKFSGYAVEVLIHSVWPQEMTIIIPKPPTAAEWLKEGLKIPFNANAWALNSGLRVLPTELLRSIENLHGYLVETQLNKTAKAQEIRIACISVSGVHSPLRFTKRRLEALEDDRKWGRENGVFDD